MAVTERRCQACGHFYDKRDAQCPACDTPKYPVNVSLESGRWRGNLNKQAAHADALNRAA